jgi:tRNA(Ile)-lysidine synthase
MPPPAAPTAPDAPVAPAEFAAALSCLAPFPPAPRLIAGVSGGTDSLALVLLAADWARTRGGDLLAGICDHGLRAESAAEAAGVAARLAERGIPARILPLGLSPGPAQQERARDARLAALLGLAAEAGRPFLLLGHQLEDQAETVAFRAARGSGAAGLAGIAPARGAAEALILRPLLGVPRARLAATLRAAGLVPIEDPSNADPRFARARLRAALAAGQGAALAEAAAALAAREARERTRLAERLAACAAFPWPGVVRLDRAALGSDALARRALGALLRLVAGAEHAPAREAIARLLAAGGGTLAGVMWRGAILAREPAACAPPCEAAPGVVWDGRWRVRAAPPGAAIGALGRDSARFRDAAPGLPAFALASLPALREAGGVRLAGPEACLFAPRGGPLCP